jgi:hypothetical protein
MNEGSTCFDRGVDCGKCCLEEGWVAVGLDPTVFNKMLIKDRHFWKGVWIVGKAAWRRVGLLWEQILQSFMRCSYRIDIF